MRGRIYLLTGLWYLVYLGMLVLIPTDYEFIVMVGGMSVRERMVLGYLIRKFDNPEQYRDRGN